MTPPAEIKALEEAIEKQRLGDAPTLTKAAAAYLQLLKGDHKTDVIVPREPTIKMICRAVDVSLEQYEKSDEVIKTVGYEGLKAAIQASQEGRE
ncbi:MAG: hypothetical protein E2O79_09940 [Caldithrix sp.]|nr:MAG: hypothetical protein E2O79_09940 [Caldithrix sp.]